MEALFLICCLTAATAFFWLVLGLLADFVVDPLVRRFKR